MPKDHVAHPIHVDGATLTMMAALVAFAPFAVDSVLPALPEAMTELGASSASFRLVSSATFIGLGIGQAIGGPLSDRVGRRLPSILAALAFAVAAFGCALAQSLPWLQLASLAMGAAASVGIVAARAAIRDLAADDHAAHLLARVWAIGGFVPVLAPLIGARILVLGGWRSIYFTLAAYGFLFAVTLWRAFPETQAEEARHTGTHGETLRIGLALIRDPRFLSYAGALTGGLVAFIGYVSAAPFIFQHIYGWTPGWFSVLYAFNGLVSVLITRWTTRHIARIGAHTLLVRGLLLCAVAGVIVIVGGVLDSVWVIAIGFIWLLASWALSMNNAVALAMSSQSVASGTASAALGVFSYAAGGLVSAAVGAMGGVGAVTTGVIMLLGVGVATFFIRFVHTHEVNQELMA